MQEQAVEAATQLLADFVRRFPSVQLLRAFVILHPYFYLKQGRRAAGTLAQFGEHLEVLIAEFGTAKETEEGMVPALVDADALREIKGRFYDYAADQAAAFSSRGDLAGADDDLLDDEVEGSDTGSSSEEEGSDEDAESGEDSDAGAGGHAGAPGAGAGKPRRKRRAPKDVPLLVRFWRALMRVAAYRNLHVGEFAKLAEIMMCMVGTSVEDERLFSILAFVHNKLRNRLDSNLEACVRAKAQQVYTPESFPYKDALKVWHEVSSRRTKPQRVQQDVVDNE